MMVRISGAESHVMAVLWEKHPRSTEDIVTVAAAAQGWEPATVKTLINRLMKKGALESRRSDGRTVYAPTVSRDDYLASESQGLLDRLFDGRLSPLVAHYANHRGLTTDERVRLKGLLDALDEND